MLRQHGAAGQSPPPMGHLGSTLLSLLAGIALALLGWTAVRQLRATSLEELVLDRRTTEPGWTVALIFHPKECPSRMELVERLNRLGGAKVVVQGILVVDPAEFEDWHDLVLANGIKFPVRTVTPSQAVSALGATPTPVLVVYDAEGRLRLLTDLASTALTTEVLTQAATLAKRPSPELRP